MSTELKLSIYSPERKLVEKQVIESVMLPGSEGQIEILPDHVPMIGTLETGFFGYVNSGGKRVRGAISSGFFEVANNEVTVLAETLELAGEVDIERAKIAQKEAEDMLKDASLDEHQFRKYQLKLQRSLVRQQLAAHRGDSTEH